MSTVRDLSLWMLTVRFSSPPRRTTVLGTGPSPDTACPSKWSRAGPGSLFHHQHLAVGLLRGLYRVAGSFACFCRLIFSFFWVSVSVRKTILALTLNKCLKSLRSSLISFFFVFFFHRKITFAPDELEEDNGEKRSETGWICPTTAHRSVLSIITHSLRWIYCHLIMSLKKSVNKYTRGCFAWV